MEDVDKTVTQPELQRFLSIDDFLPGKNPSQKGIVFLGQVFDDSSRTAIASVVVFEWTAELRGGGSIPRENDREDLLSCGRENRASPRSRKPGEGIAYSLDLARRHQTRSRIRNHFRWLRGPHSTPIRCKSVVGIRFKESILHEGDPYKEKHLYVKAKVRITTRVTEKRMGTAPSEGGFPAH